jgi:hypothetical protein
MSKICESVPLQHVIFFDEIDMCQFGFKKGHSTIIIIIIIIIRHIFSLITVLITPMQRGIQYTASLNYICTNLHCSRPLQPVLYTLHHNHANAVTDQKLKTIRPSSKCRLLEKSTACTAVP